MKFYFKLLFISISISCLGILALQASQIYQKQSRQEELVKFYSREIDEVYFKGYDVDLDGHLIWSQYQFEKTLRDLEEKMLKEGFNRAEIALMKDEGRRKGQEARRAWDDARQKLNK